MALPSDDELQRLLRQAAPAPESTIPVKQITLNAVNIGVQPGPTPDGRDGLALTFLTPNGEAYVVPMAPHVARAVAQKLLDELE
jgi:hypothetical protein